MSASDSFIQNWYFHLPNILLAALIYTIIGYYLLAMFFGQRTDAVILRVFASVTDPILRLVRTITPRIVPDGLVPVFAVCWLQALRPLWYLTCVAAGMKPQIGG